MTKVRYISNELQSIFIIRMMHLKVKENCSAQTNQTKKSLSPAHLKQKVKNNNAPQPRTVKMQKQMPVGAVKRRPHQPSKSSIQTLEHKHYNSPNSGILSYTDLRPINQFTFTHLLQKNSKNQPFCISETSRHQPEQGDHSISSNHPQHANIKMKKTPLTGRGGTQTSASVYFEGEPYLVEDDFLKAKAEKCQDAVNKQEKQRTFSDNKSVSKSPARVTNTHKLNNTPKLKQKRKQNKQESRKKESKTFTSVLKTQTGEKIGHNKKESINLLCSEKIYKFIEDNHTEKGPLTAISSNHKSNLQSTGVINLTMPLDKTEMSHPNNRDFQNTRGSTKMQGSGKQPIHEFEEGEANEGAEVFSRHLDAIKDKVEQVQRYLSNKIELYDQNSLAQKIASSFNPELGQIDISLTVARLNEIAGTLQRSFQKIISTLQRYSLQITQQIQNQIRVLHDSKTSLMDWTAIQKQVDQKNALQQHLSKTEIINMRLENLSISLVDSGSKEVGASAWKKRAEELGDINSQIQKQISEIMSLTSNSSWRLDDANEQSIGVEKLAYFREKSIYFEKLFSSIEEVLTF